MRIFSFSIALFLVTSNINAATFKNQFGFVNTSYRDDLSSSIVTYKTIERYYEGNDPYYVVCPAKDKEFFVEEYNQNLKTGAIKKLPTAILTDEEVVEKCGISDIYGLRKEDGWKRQQVIKLCFSKMGLLQHYIAIDSDVRAAKKFNKDLFYDKKTGILKIPVNPHRHERSVSDLIAKVIGNGATGKNFFITEPGTYNSDILLEMIDYTKKRDYLLSDFYELIKYSSWEMQWQGEYLSTMHPEKFIPNDVYNITIHGHRESIKKICANIAYIRHATDYKDKVFHTIQSTMFLRRSYQPPRDIFLSDVMKHWIATRSLINHPTVPDYFNDIDHFVNVVCNVQVPYRYNMLKYWYYIKCDLLKRCTITNKYKNSYYLWDLFGYRKTAK